MKSDKEMKDNSIHYSNLLQPPIKCQICDVFPGLECLSEREEYALGRVRFPVKKKASGQMYVICTLITTLPTFHALMSGIYLISCYFM